MSLKVIALKEDPNHGQALAAELRARGHTVSVVATPRLAVRELLEGDYDVIISALHFKSGSAFDFLRTVRADALLRRKPFVFCCIMPSQITKTWIESIDIAARALGADDVLLVEKYDDPRLAVILEEIEKRLNKTKS